MASRLPRPVRVSPGEHLRAEITRLHLKQATVSEAIGVSRQTINNVINGRQAISRKMAGKLGELMGQTSDYWLRNGYPATPKRDTVPAKNSSKAVGKMKRKQWQRSPALRKVQTFRGFVLKLSDAEAPDGKLVDEIKADRGFPDVDTWSELRFHLYRLGTSDERLVTARALWKKYHKSMRASPTS